MPRESRTGRALMGVGMAPISVDGRVLPGGLVGGWGGWLDDRTVVVQDVSLGYAQVIAVDVETGSWRVLAARGANQVVAGDGVWAIWSAADGYLDSFGRSKPADVTVDQDWYPLDCYGGKVIIKPKHHGPDYRFAWDGRRVEQSAPPKWLYECGHVEGFGLCVWPYGDKTRGIVLSTDGHDFGPDLVVYDSGHLMVASSYGAGERPHELRTYHVDFGNNLIWFRPNPNEPQITIPFTRRDLTKPTPQPDEPPGVAPTFAPLAHRVRVHVFGGPGFRMGLGPQHDDLSVPQSHVFMTLGRDDLDAKLEEAARLRVPLCAYVDEVSYPPSWVPIGGDVEVIPVVQGYPYRPSRTAPMQPVSETVDAIAATLNGLRLARGWSSPLGLVLAAYRQIDGHGRYNWPLQHVLDLQGECWALVKQYRVTDVFVFHANRAGGADGVASRPEFRLSLDRLLAAARESRDTPIPPKPKPTPPPPAPRPEPPAPPPVAEPPTPQPPLNPDHFRRVTMDRIALRLEGQFLSNDDRFDLGVERRDAIGECEVLTVHTQPDGRVRFAFAKSGRWFSENDEGQAETRAEGAALGHHEVFIAGVAPSGEAIAFRARDVGAATQVYEVVEVP